MRHMAEDIVRLLDEILLPQVGITDLFEVGLGHGIVERAVEAVVEVVHFLRQLIRTDILFQFAAVADKEIGAVLAAGENDLELDHGELNQAVHPS